jgi:lysophospholipase L1-like esterase
LALTVTPGAAGRRDARQPAEIDYFALGDSVASGHGLPDSQGAPCQRSRHAYPYVVAGLLAERYGAGNVRFEHLACSGARVATAPAEMVRSCLRGLGRAAADDARALCAYKSLHNQVTRVLDQLSDRPALVSITIGVNDARWTQLDHAADMLLETDQAFIAEIDQLAAQIERALSAELERLLAHPNVDIVLTDYYDPFNDESVVFRTARRTQQLTWGPWNVSAEPCTGTDRNDVEHHLSCAERVDYGLRALRAITERAAAASAGRVAPASLLDTFRGHEAGRGICGLAAPSAGTSWIQSTGGDRLGTRPDCFHPNEDGARAIALAIDAAIVSVLSLP